MTRSLSLLALALCVTASALAQDAPAQDEGAAPGAMMQMSFHKCTPSKLNAFIEQNRAVMPAVQSVVDDGLALQAGQAVHVWGDEYNFMSWNVAADMNGIMTMRDSLNARIMADYADAPNPYDDTCSEHRDNFYEIVASTSRAEADPVTEDNSPVLALSFYNCRFDGMEAIVEEERGKLMPLAQELVDEGQIRSRTAMVHVWGDEWSWVVATAAADMAALEAGLDEMGRRYEAAHGSDGGFSLEGACSAHKDNIYRMALVTNPAAE